MEGYGRFDKSAAVTRSMLGWGVVAGPFYLVVGVALALTRTGFDLTEHALSLLLLGDYGWLHASNLVLTGVMTIVAGWGFIRAIPNGRGLAMGVLIIVYGVGLFFAMIFPPDPVSGFPPGSEDGTASLAGIMHLVAGAIGFLALAASAFAYAGWCHSVGAARALVGYGAGGVILAGFFGGAALATSSIGVGLLWLAVVVGLAWLALASAHVYTVVPHPVVARRTGHSGDFRPGPPRRTGDGERE